MLKKLKKNNNDKLINLIKGEVYTKVWNMRIS
jgi:hypothetical protein